MRQVREILRLTYEGALPSREVARRVGTGSTSVRVMLPRFRASELSWPLPADMTDPALEHALYGVAEGRRGQRQCPEPDWAVVNRELKRKHVTLQILWDEYIELQPDGYRYSRFCALYRAWEARLPVTMRQTHLGGDRTFVDYAGDTVPVVVDGLTGEIRDAHLFVAVLGASSLSFAWASWTETLPDWTDAHVRAFEFFGGVTRLLVPDNAKVAVIKACLYDPQVNRTYAELAAHYGTAVLPARPYRPRDKAKVEACVGIVERWLLGRLRHRGLAWTGRTQRRHRRPDGAAQRPRHAPFRSFPPPAVRRTRRTASPAAAGRTLCSCPVAPLQGRHRLSCRGREALLFGTLSPRPGRGRSAPDGADGRNLPEGRAYRRAHAWIRQRPAHHHRRPHALQPSPLRELDGRAPAGRGR